MAIHAAYILALLPPYFRAFKQQIEEGVYVWDAPGHQGGEAYRRHPVGAEFHRLFGEGIMRADLGLSVPDLGDWLEHMGAPAEAERRVARVFGADWTFYVVGGFRRRLSRPYVPEDSPGAIVSARRAGVEGDDIAQIRADDAAESET